MDKIYETDLVLNYTLDISKDRDSRLISKKRKQYHPGNNFIVFSKAYKSV